MARVEFAGVGPLGASEQDALVGLTDITIQMTANGPVLLAATRGDGFLTGYALGSAPGAATQQDSWAIPAGLLQLESTDLEVIPHATGDNLVLVGLRGPVLQGLDLTGNAQGNQFSGNADYSAAGVTMGDLTELEMMPDGEASGVAALRGGGLVQLAFNADGTATAQSLSLGVGLQNAQASDIAMVRHQGQNFAFVSYGTEDTVAVLREGANGQMQYLTGVTAGGGFWIDRPGALTVIEGTDGGLYVVVASSGSGSLSVLEVNPATGALTPVDHVLDGRDTRFAQASQVTAFEVNGQDYLIAAGADDGLTLFALLPGGRLQEIETIEGTAALPLNGITDVEVLPGPDGARVFVATQGAPYLSEFSISFDAPGVSALAPAGGGALTGTGADDILSGQGGADQLSGGAGHDLLMDGAGADRMTGGAGADTFIFVEDGARDIVLDFQPGVDKIDLTSLGVLRPDASLTIIPRSWGAELRVGDEVIELRTASGASLSAAEFQADWFIGLDRVSLEEIIIIHPDPPPPPPPPPPPSEPDAPTQLPGAPPPGPVWIPPPSFAFPWGSSVSRAISQRDDLVRAGSSNDRILSLRGDDSISGGNGNDYILAGADQDLIFGGQGFDTIFGELGQDTINGGADADLLGGGGGHDFILGGAGFDKIFGGPGNDAIWAQSSPDRVYGGAGDDWLSAGSNLGGIDGMWGELGNDTMFGSVGFDFLDGGPGHDVLDGGPQADNLYGGAGNDTLFGGDGLDRLFGDDGHDQLIGGAGNDGLFGLRGNDTLWGGSGRDRFFAGIGDDMLDGGSGNDTLYAGAGFDTLIGGAGDDRLFGNFNADRFVFFDGHGDDVIVDFDARNDLEKIDLSGISAITSLTDLMASHLTQVGANVVINTGGGNSITLLGVTRADLDEADFLF